MCRRLLFVLFAFFVSGLTSARLYADGPAFDLVGPSIDIHVQRNSKTLPISQVANLQPGDRLWLHPVFPDDQSARYVLIVAFLRGATNPPPEDWFTRIESWNKDVRQEGAFVTVPPDAQEALLFMAPDTNGDLSTLRQAVRGRPGIFVRAAKDLQQASWDRMRLDAYLDEVKDTSATDPKLLKDRAAMMARTLNMRVDQQCFDKPTEQQGPCLTQDTGTLVLDDANAQSLVTQITSGNTMDMVNQISYSQAGGAGIYSAYVGAVVDMVRILGTIRTAHFQYIPALGLGHKDTLNLRLNSPPSFRSPKSVLVIALPPVGPPKFPALHPLDQPLNSDSQPPSTPGSGSQDHNSDSSGYCAQKPDLVLDVQGAPLVFATGMAHDLKLHIEVRGGDQKQEFDIPVKAEAVRGGLVLGNPVPVLPVPEVTGVLRGKWGFDDWEGPRFTLKSAQAGRWTLNSGEQNALVVGREDLLHLTGDHTACVESVTAKLGKEIEPKKLNWKASKSGELEVTVPLKDAEPGPVAVAIHQYGLSQPDEIALKSYAEAASLDHLSLSVGDSEALLRGRRLDEVASAELGGINLMPVALNRVEDSDQLSMKASSSTGSLPVGEKLQASVLLRDGRKLQVPTTITRLRPRVELMSKGVQTSASSSPQAGDKTGEKGISASTQPYQIHFGSQNDLAADGKIVFFLHSLRPESFPRAEKVEVASVDGDFSTELSIADGSLMLEDKSTALGVVDIKTRFGPSAFGPVRVRAVASDGVTGDWLTLGTLVRVPGFQELHCPRTPQRPCTLTGANLFLIASLSGSADFANPVEIPGDFTGTTLNVPHPVDGALFLKLRDDLQTVQALTMPILPSGPPIGPPPMPSVAPATGPAVQGPAPDQAPGQLPAKLPASPKTKEDASVASSPRH